MFRCRRVSGAGFSPNTNLVPT